MSSFQVLIGWITFLVTNRFSFQIVDRIHEILEQRNLRQKDLAQMLGKSEAEISKWMRGTHNFTIDTVVAIEEALQAPVLQVYHEMEIA